MTAFSDEQARDALRRHGGYMDEMGYRNDEAVGRAILTLEGERDQTRRECEALRDYAGRLAGWIDCVAVHPPTCGDNQGACNCGADYLLRQLAQHDVVCRHE